MRLFIMLIAFLAAGCASPPPAEAPHAAPGILIIAHRGASGELPEHTMQAYARAIELGADYIEPDLVMTRDGVLVARHDPWLSDSTDIGDRPEFASRKTTLTGPDGQELTDWFAWDFTLAELKTLRARQVRPDRPRQFDDLWAIPTYDEIAELAAAETARTGRLIGLYPETKWPRHHQDRGLDMTSAMEAALRRHGHETAEAPVFLQSFEPFILIELKERVGTRLVQLVFPLGTSPDAPPSVDLETLATYSAGVGPHKSMVNHPLTGEATGYAARARALGLEVHPWTYRDDGLPGWAATPEAEIRAAIEAGATGVFTDFPGTGYRTVHGSGDN
ncbi:glycerophosphodiester phosphodiesterase family protein [Hyphomonas sp.]|uniref:glycerophosphodiester phosphodiesterase family protein n=1 Tax=Hyphomonas sp. TaxID=87 RepID=UPI00391A2786